MNDTKDRHSHYIVTIGELDEAPGTFYFTFVPRGLQPARGPNGTPKRVPQFIVGVRQEHGLPVFDWSGSDDPGADRAEIESDIAARLQDRAIWIERITLLVAQVERWAKEMNWATRRIEKKIEDSWIGKHKVPALLMQEDFSRVLLEPVGPSAPGVDGIVELYLMPAYEDIARLFYCGDQWKIDYAIAAPTASSSEDEAMLLTKENFEKILVELKKHAE